MMIGAERVAAVIPVATVSRIRKKHIFILVITNPLITTLCLGQFLGFAAQPTV
jgi:hypothetical protein